MDIVGSSEDGDSKSEELVRDGQSTDRSSTRSPNVIERMKDESQTTAIAPF